jgi:hypothetical protein
LPKTATFCGGPCTSGVKTFLKVVLVLVAALIAIRLLPVTLAIGCGLGLAVLVIAGLGLSAVAVALVVVIALAAVLAPIWLPLLAIIGIIALVKRNRSAAT